MVGRISRHAVGCTRAAWDHLNGLITLAELPGGVALPGHRARRAHRRTAVAVDHRRDARPVSVAAVGPGERYVRPGKVESERRATVHRDPRFLRAIVYELLETGTWDEPGSADVAFKLWIGTDGIPPGLKVSWVFLGHPCG